MPVVAPYLPYGRLREEAAKFLGKYHPSGELPIPIEQIIEFDFKLDIVPVPGLKDEFDVDAFITSDLLEIRVDRFTQQSRSNRYRFSLAHELSHVVIHQSVFRELKFSSIGEWKMAMESIPAEQYQFIEAQACCLAGLILVPSAPLKDIFESRKAQAEKAGLDLEEMDARNRKIVESNIGEFFAVSRDVIARRMAFDKLWTRR